jgi:hypothetical protein
VAHAAPHARRRYFEDVTGRARVIHATDVMSTSDCLEIMRRHRRLQAAHSDSCRGTAAGGSTHGICTVPEFDTMRIWLDPREPRPRPRASPQAGTTGTGTPPGAWLKQRGPQPLSFDYCGGRCWAAGCSRGGLHGMLQRREAGTGYEMPCPGAGTVPWVFRSQRNGLRLAA